MPCPTYGAPLFRQDWPHGGRERFELVQHRDDGIERRVQGSMTHHLLERTIVSGATWHVDWQGWQAIDHLLQWARHVGNDD
jgi:hypothetical protein